MSPVLRLGTRNSKLALIQAHTVKDSLSLFFPNLAIEIVPIVTIGDRRTDVPLDQIGGKGVFIKELEHALIDSRIDIAVHCLKDVTVACPKELTYAGFIKADYIPDVLVSEGVCSLNDSLVIGTSSKRRQALLTHYYPHLTFKLIRGNVLTRLQKLKQHEYDAIVLSEASIRRLAISDFEITPFSIDSFVPAPGQGVLALQVRQSDSIAHEYVDAVNDSTQAVLSRFEYRIMEKLGFDCDLPLGLHCATDSNGFSVHVFSSRSDLTVPVFRRFNCSVLDEAFADHIVEETKGGLS